MKQIKLAKSPPPGLRFARYAYAIQRFKGDHLQAAQYAKRWRSTPELAVLFQYMAEHPPAPPP